MNVLVLAGIGVGFVLILILCFRVHAIVSLLLASLFLLAATPRQVYLENALKTQRHKIEAMSGNWIGLSAAVADGKYVLWRQGEKLTDGTILELERIGVSDEAKASASGKPLASHLVWYRARLPGGVVIVRGDQVVPQPAVEQALDSRWSSLGGRLAEGFARTAKKLGIPVTMAAIIGACMLQSGAATRLINFLMALFGQRGTAPALATSGFFLGIPVFFDNVFYLLLPLAKAAGKIRPEQYVTSVMAIIVGATMAHSLVPPTPGPLLVATALEIDVGLMMLGGVVVGGLAAGCGLLYGTWCSRWLKLPAPTMEADVSATENVRVPLLIAPLPIALPIALLGGAAVARFLVANVEQAGMLKSYLPLLELMGDSTLVFIAAGLLAMAILQRYGQGGTVGQVVARGLADAGAIVLLTSAGGAFGYSLQQLQLADAIARQFTAMATPWGVLVMAFALTALIRGAQGSATVAMMTSVAIIAPVVDAISLPFHTLYIALAIGCGSKPLSWMNDSGFWQVSTMSGMTVSQTLRSFTVALTLMGIIGFAFTLLGAWLIPLV